MQDSNPNFPGFYIKPDIESQSFGNSDDALNEESEMGIDSLGEDSDEFDELSPDNDEFEEEEDENINVSKSNSKLDDKFDGFSDWDSDWDEEFDVMDEKMRKELDGFTPAGVGYGNITEETLKKFKKEKVSKAEKKRIAREAKKKEEEEMVTVCARCHSLRNYGHVKNPNVENLIPDFDFDRLISTRLMKPSTSAPLVVMVVDSVDFDGSFPKRAAKSFFKALEGSKKNPKLLKLPKLVLVATKVDLLPSQVSPTRLDKWVRNRAKANGAPKLSGVYLVSARKDLGVRNLLGFIKDLAGPRGNVWVIGAQNAGKSTLINTFAKKEGVKVSRLTEAAIPGTTLGILRIPGILPAKAKMYDTPGLLHPYLMSMRLNREEQKMIEIRKELQPRTYRMKAGQTVHVGGLVRLDLSTSSVDTIYITIWASPNVSLHMGKTENAEEMKAKHVGIRLQPPIAHERVSELGSWIPREIKVTGVSWDVNSVDIAICGFGWFSLGLKGEATVTLWTFEGIKIIEREPLVLDRSPSLERPGFLLPKAISDFIGGQSKMEAKAKRLEEEKMEMLT